MTAHSLLPPALLVIKMQQHAAFLAMQAPMCDFHCCEFITLKYIRVHLASTLYNVASSYAHWHVPVILVKEPAVAGHH